MTQLWSELSPEHRQRKAREICRRHDSDALWDLTEQWLTQVRHRGGRIAPSTLTNYRYWVWRLLRDWREVDLLKPGAAQGTAWLRQLEDAGASDGTRMVHLAAGRMFYTALRW